MMKEYMASLETKLEAEKERNYFASVFAGDSEIVEYLIQLPNIGGYVIKRSHHVSSLGLNRSKDLCNLFRRVLKIKWHDGMMT